MKAPKQKTASSIPGSAGSRKRSKKRTTSSWKSYLDRLFSELVRKRQVCERCGKRYGVQFQTSHIIGRGNLEVRWNPANAFCFCGGCHIWWHHHVFEASEFLAWKLGPEKLIVLKVFAKPTRQWGEQEFRAVEENLKKLLTSQ
jgi:hypothetical protein